MTEGSRDGEIHGKEISAPQPGEANQHQEGKAGNGVQKQEPETVTTAV